MADCRHLLLILPYSIFQARNRRRRIHGFLSIIQIARSLRTQTIAMLTATMMMALHMPQEDTFPRAQHRCSQGPSFGVSQCSMSWYTTRTHIGPNSFECHEKNSTSSSSCFVEPLIKETPDFKTPYR